MDVFHVTEHRYAMGYTFGDETRSLEVCAHDANCYGDYVKQKCRLRKTPLNLHA